MHKHKYKDLVEELNVTQYNCIQLFCRAKLKSFV